MLAIWLAEDWTEIFDSAFATDEMMTVFWGLFASLCAVAVSIMFAYIVFDYKMKEKRMQILCRCRRDFAPFLGAHCLYNDDVMNVIFDFCGIPSSPPFDTLPVLTSSFECTPMFLFARCAIYPLLLSAFLLLYFPLWFTAQVRTVH